MLPNFLHHFDHATCVAFLKKVKGSLAPGGQTIAVEFVPNEERTAPPMPAIFSFMMLATTPKGQAYTAREYAAMAREAGYKGATATALPPTPQSMVRFES